MATSFPAAFMRGGTSKGLFIEASQLPFDTLTRDRVLLTAMGSPDKRQIDGLGGAHPLTSKVALLSPPTHPDADIDYLFLQVSVETGEVSHAQNCGNMLAGVGPWAVRKGWVTAREGKTSVRVHMLNTGGLAICDVPTSGGDVIEEGETTISGVPGKGAAISIEFLGLAGASTGALFPTGAKIDHSYGIEATCIDNGMPVILLRANDLGCSGDEAPEDLEQNHSLKAKIEAIRLDLAVKMNLGDVRNSTVPKITLLSPPKHGGFVSTRTFIPHRVHQAIGVLGAVSVATGCVIKGTVGEQVLKGSAPKAAGSPYAVEHPTGYFEVELGVDGETINRSALVRTARLLMSGDVFVPKAVWGEE